MSEGWWATGSAGGYEVMLIVRVREVVLFLKGWGLSREYAADILGGYALSSLRLESSLDAP